MKFIQIADGISVRKSNIEAIQKSSDLSSTVYTADNEFKSDLPYSTLIALLELDAQENGQNIRTNRLLEQIINNQQRNVA